MQQSHLPNMKYAVLACLGTCLVSIPAARALDSSDNVTVVSSRASDDYNRGTMRDGTPKAETYAFAEGGHWNAVADPSLDSVRFIDVARTVSVPLASKAYLPTRDPKTTKLLIVVYWGRTNTSGASSDDRALQALQVASGTLSNVKSASAQQLTASSKISVDGNSGQMVCGHIETNMTAQQVTDQTSAENAVNGAMAVVAAENTAHDKAYEQTAAMLGYDSFLAETSSMPGTALASRRQDAIDELRHDRYFVVLMAYDFQMMWKEKKHKLLWETRMSIGQRGAEFDQELAQMAKSASQYYGEDTHGLVRRDMPAGHVDVGALQSLGMVASK